MAVNSKKGKRELIIEAAVQVFSSKGYHNTRMEEIANVAGIGKGTIYEYFKSKLQLFQEMLGDGLRVYYDNFDPENMEQMPVAERLRMIFETHIRFCRDHKDLTRILFWDTDVIDEELREWGYSMRQDKEGRILDIIKDGVARGELRDVDLALTKIIITGAIAATWAPITLDDWDVEPGLLARNAVDILMNGIRAV
ncbi:MAG: TetR/AcrR family transcriptional regulator [Syntrophomonas sp.]